MSEWTLKRHKALRAFAKRRGFGPGPSYLYSPSPVQIAIEVDAALDEIERLVSALKVSAVVNESVRAKNLSLELELAKIKREVEHGKVDE
jgi:hypothetical protein